MRIEKRHVRQLLLLAAATTLFSCNFGRTMCKDTQGEAFNDLGEAASEMDAYKAVHAEYATTFPQLEKNGWRPESSNYVYSIEGIEKDTFTIRARGTGAMEGDEWTVGPDGIPKEVKDLCK